ncbi:microtubule-associated protein futsch-like [Larimichthys crocea]|uniref:microtubule-associated protein futsch-like n=1 Tax=Larimichthys crocea TaxID=215358 RepID=UPI000F5DA8D7|nr:microtubule-associated protein futsch-like [Larimichthys crocea]
MSSSSSFVSENEPTSYTVNPYLEEDIGTDPNKPAENYDTQRHAKHSSSSSSSDSDENDNTVKQEVKQELGEVDFEHTTRVNKGQDIKAPALASDSSSSSGSDVETTNQINRHVAPTSDVQRPRPPSSSSSSDSDVEDYAVKKETTTPSTKDMAGLPIKEYHPVSHIRAPSLPTDSSSSCDTDDEITHHAVKQEPGKVDLEHTTRVNKGQDIKAPSLASDSSSSSGSDVETTNQINRHVAPTSDVQRPRHPSSSSSSDSDVEDYTVKQETTTPSTKVMAGLPVKEYQPVNHIRAPSPPTDSSSSSDTDNEITHHTVKQEPGKVDLEHTTHVNRNQDIKAPSLASDSSSSSGSNVETTNQIKRQVAPTSDVQRPRHSFSSSSSDSDEEDKQKPTLYLDRIPRTMKRVAFKAPSPSDSSSSSSDSEDETNQIKKQEQGETWTERLPPQVSQTSSPDSQTQWPLLDLEHTTSIKKRLDIKAPSQPSDSSSSSSDSEDETTHHTKKERPELVGISKLPFQESQTVSQDSEKQWPAVNLANITRIKKRLDFKVSSQPSDFSSSSSDSEDETTNQIKKQEQGETLMEMLPPQVSQTSSPDPQTQWPLLDLERTTPIKKRLDIKAPSQPSDSSSSSSDSEDETAHHTKKERPELVGISKLPFKESQTVSQDSEKQWPAVSLANVTRIKKRLDIKVSSQPSDSSSSSSDSEDQTTNQIKKQEQGETYMERRPPKVSQTSSPDPQTQWPLLDLERTTPVKKHLDIKAPSQPSDSSSSSDSEDETNQIKKQEQGETYMKRLPPKVSQTSSPDPQTQWPLLDLERTTPIKKRLDIKAPSQPSDSSSSSGDSEDETTHHAKKERPELVGISKFPFQESQTVSRDSEKQWPAVDLGDITHIKKRLDIKVPSQPSDSSSSSSDSEDETGHIEKQKPGKVGIAVSQDPETLWSAVDLANTNGVKKRLDIKAPSQLSDSSSSSDSEDETTNNTNKMEDLHNSPTTIKHTGFGTLISSSPKTDDKIKLEKYQVITDQMRDEKTSGSINTPPEINSELEARWSTMNLGISRFRKRLNITPDKHEPSKLPSSPPPDLDLSGLTENDSLITYKRSIFKPSSPLSNSFSDSDPTIDQENKRQTRAELVTVQGPSHSMGDRNPSLAPTRVSSMTFNDVIRKRMKQSRHTINVDVPPEIRWTDPSISSQRRNLDIGLSTPQQPPPAEPELPTLPDSSNSSLSANYVSHASSRAFDEVDNSPGSTNEILRAISISEQKRERKGLSAIKAMSSQRQQWDTQDESFLFDNHDPQVDTSFNYAKSEEDIKPLAKQPLTRLHTSSTYSTLDLLHDIPHYKSHDTPPPIPATPPPDEAVELTWGSLQSSKKQGLEGTGSYLQQSRNTETSDPSSVTSQNPAVNFDSPNISYV